VADQSLGRTGNPIYPDEGGYRNSPMPIGYEPAAVPCRYHGSRPSFVGQRLPAAAPVLPQAVGPRVPGPDLSENTQLTPMITPALVEPPFQQQQAMSGKRRNRAIARLHRHAAMTAACQR
jgi:hypothetical protein